MEAFNAAPVHIGYIHSVLTLDSRHFGIVAAAEYKSLGEHVDMHMQWVWHCTMCTHHLLQHAASRYK